MRGFHFHLKRTTKRLIYIVIAIAFLVLLTESRAPTTLDTILERGVLRVATFPGSTTYYKNDRGEGGFEYLLCKAFAEELGVELQMTPMENLGSLFITIGGPRADFAAAGLSVTPDREKIVTFSRPYDHVTQKLIYRMGNKRPGRERGMDGQKLVVIANSSHSENLRKIQKEFPDMVWEERRDAEMLQLMEMVHNGEIDLTVVDSNAYLVNRSLYPKAKAALDISEPEPLAWAFPKSGDDSLLQAANKFLEAYEQSGELAKLKELYLDQTKRFSVAGSQLFMKRIESRLPKYISLFQKTAEKYNIDWHLLAAISYQESHWDPKAKSPTGVRGLMMLTLPTAREMGVNNRLDPQQSIDGGARYYLQKKERLPDDILEPDRTWLALASYNVGYGHLEDARILTERGGKDPHLWKDVMEFLPLLQQKKYYSTVRYGFARGREPVQYVQNIRHFQSILRWHSLENQRKEKQNNDTQPEDWVNRPLLPL